MVVISILGVLLVLAREARTRRGTRMSFQLLPSPGFQPSFEDVRRFASSLQGGTSLPRRILGLPEPVILRLRRAAPRESVFILEVPARLARRVRAACYPGVEVLEAEPEPRRARPRGQAAAEMVLRRSSLRPLRRVPLAPDPKGALCPVLDCLRPGEEAEVALALWRAEGPWHRYLARARRAPAGAGLAAAVLAELKGRPGPRGRGRELPDKAAGEPVFRARLILRVAAESRRRARGLLADLCSGLEVLAGENSLRRVGALRSAPAGGIPSPRRLARGSLHPRRAQFVALHEVAGFLHPPSASCRGTHIARTEVAPAPPGLPAYELPGPRRRADRRGEDTVLPLGWVRAGAGRLEVGFHASDLLGPVYVSGKARSGKTWLLQPIAIHLARSGAGFCFVDPHADAGTQLRQLVAEHVASWALSDHDGHAQNFLRLPGTGLVRVDRGQAFRYFGTDRLDAGYHPNAAFGAPRPLYHRLYELAAAGEVPFDPAWALPAIRAFEAIPEAEYRELLRPVAEAGVKGDKAGWLPAMRARAARRLGTPSVPEAEVVEEFLRAACERKASLRADLAAFFSKVLGQPASLAG